MQKNINNNSIRQNFLQKANTDDLNNYFKKLEQLAIKNPQYKNIYDEDTSYLINNMTYQSGGNIFDFFIDLFKKKEPEDELFKKISKTPRNTYCAISTQDTLSCVKKMEDNISDIIETLNQGTDDKYEKGEITKWKTAIVDFFEFLYCCIDTYSDNNFEEQRKVIIMPIVTKIINNDNYLRYATKVIRIMNYNENNKIVSEYLNILRTTDDKKKLDEAEKNMLTKHSFGKLYLTKIVGNILHNKLDKMKYIL
jgi:CHASE3 domain sensor protein